MMETPRKKIIIDSREQHLIDHFKQKSEQELEIQVQKLDSGDILISDEICIERKEGFDYIKSLIDNRLFEQILRLKETYASPILLIEGLNQFVFDNVKVKKASIYGSLVKIAYGLQIPIIHTLNLEDTALVIERLVAQLKPKNSEFPLVPRTTPKKMNLEERRRYIVEGLLECGDKRAQLLIERFKTPFEVFMAIKNTKILYTKTGNPKGISGPLEGIQGIGHKFVEKNKEVLFGIDPEISSDKKKLIQTIL